MTPDDAHLISAMILFLVVFAVIGLSHLRGIDRVVLRGFSELGEKLDRIEKLLRALRDNK